MEFSKIKHSSHLFPFAVNNDIFLFVKNVQLLPKRFSSALPLSQFQLNPREKNQGFCINIKLTWSQVWFAGVAYNQDLWFDYFLFKTFPFMKYNQVVS